jgi:hypothetical protein
MTNKPRILMIYHASVCNGIAFISSGDYPATLADAGFAYLHVP